RVSESHRSNIRELDVRSSLRSSSGTFCSVCSQDLFLRGTLVRRNHCLAVCPSRQANFLAGYFRLRTPAYDVWLNHVFSTLHPSGLHQAIDGSGAGCSHHRSLSFQPEQFCATSFTERFAKSV